MSDAVVDQAGGDIFFCGFTHKSSHKVLVIQSRPMFFFFIEESEQTSYLLQILQMIGKFSGGGTAAPVDIAQSCNHISCIFNSQEQLK
jgi:hypothetical protein